LHDDLVFAPRFFAQIRYLVSELGYERIVIVVYPFVHPRVYPVVQVDEYPTIRCLIVAQGVACNPFANCPFGYS